jgi:hypothetical protein
MKPKDLIDASICLNAARKKLGEKRFIARPARIERAEESAAVWRVVLTRMRLEMPDSTGYNSEAHSATQRGSKRMKVSRALFVSDTVCVLS